MYTKNPQIRISLLIIHIPPSVCHLMCLMVYLDNVPCISIIWLPDPVPSCYFFGKKLILWNVVFLVNVIKFLWRGFLFWDRLCTVRESAWPNFMQCICWGLAKFTEKKVFELSTHFQFSHSNSFILSRQVLCWPCFDCFSSYGRRRRRTHPFECIIQSTNV